MNRLNHFRVLFDFHALGIVQAEGGDVELMFQLFLHPLVIRRKVRFCELDPVLEQELMILVDQVLIWLPALGKNGILAGAEVLSGEVEHGELPQ